MAPLEPCAGFPSLLQSRGCSLSSVSANTEYGFFFFSVTSTNSRPECVNPSFPRCKLEAVIMVCQGLVVTIETRSGSDVLRKKTQCTLLVTILAPLSLE